jgi:hypothetical protein
VVREDVLALLPEEPAGSAEASRKTAKDWLTAEVKRIKVAREIIPNSKTELAKLLEGRIEAAARRGEVTKPVRYRHIVNNLEAWGLWPISSA